jgi:LmbE family N-acetylglucosaminyl deacetylase
VCAIVSVLLALDIATAFGRSVLVVAPHPDDESLMAAGVIRRAISEGDSVVVAIMTNGDFTGTATGHIRQGESVAAMSVLGLAEDHVVFLGYGDGSLLTLSNSTSDTTVFRSAAGQTQTYGSRGLGRRDYHSHAHGVPGPYSRRTILQDLSDLLVTVEPDDIYTTSFHESHSDHRATHLLVVAALAGLRQRGVNLPVRLHESFVHEPCQFCDPAVVWPMPAFTPSVPFPKPPHLSSTPMLWNRIESIPVPLEMQRTSTATNMKYQAIARYRSQTGNNPRLFAFVKKNEFFWITDHGLNLALTASVTVSSENAASQQQGRKAVDQIVSGLPVDAKREWATVGQLGGAWIRLSWARPVVVSQVVLHDRPNTTDNVVAGRLLFSNGSAVAVGRLPSAGAELAVTFPSRTVSWVEFRIDQAVGQNIGLAEIRVLGKSAGALDNHGPIVTDGPTTTPAVTFDTGTTNLMIRTLDVDDDMLQYAWTAEGGSIAGSGPSVTFTAPRVTTETFVAVTATVTDGRGGRVRHSTFVTVTPRAGGAGVALALVAVAPAVIGAGQSAQATVTLSGGAPPGGTTIILRTTNASAVTIPASVVAPAGSTRATFTVTGRSVGVPTAVSVSASLGGTTKSANVTVVQNLAPSARVTVSSENTSTGQLGVKAVDGVIAGYPQDPTREWVTRGQLAGAWIRLTWTTAVAMSEVTLHDRPNTADNVRSGRLLFADGSSVAVSTLPNDAAERRVTFPARTAQWVEFRIDQAVGLNIGLAELRVFKK